MNNSVEMSDRLRMVINYTGLNDSEFAKKMKASKSTVSDWANGRKPIPAPRIVRMLEIVPEINGDWFMTGEGNMIKEGMAKSNTDEVTCNDPNCIKLIEKLNKKINEQNKRQAESDKMIIQLQKEKIEWLQSGKKS